MSTAVDSLAHSKDPGNFGSSAHVSESGKPLSIAAKSDATSTTVASGLPVYWQAGAPVEPEVNGARRRQLIVKRLFDVVLASLALLFFAPLLTIIAIVIKLSSHGPVLFRQQREGLGGAPFEALKFRSMRMDDCDVTGVTQTLPNDPRCTAIGRFIRKTSIDELPQLFNVVRGEMSLVGPRPHVAGMLAAGVPYKILVPYYNARLTMRPGITGWAQANGLRGTTVSAIAARARVEHDIAYVQNFSLWLDIRIIGKTIMTEFFAGTGI